MWRKGSSVQLFSVIYYGFQRGRPLETERGSSCGLSWGVQVVFQARLIRHAVDDGFLSKGCCFDNKSQGDIEKHIFFRTILECEENECLPLQGSGSTPSL